MQREQQHGDDGVAAIPEISVTELKERIDRSDVPLVVDVREPFERDIADLPEVGQLRIPVGEFEARAEDLDPDAEIVLYCRSGARSGWATQRLRDRGFANAWNLRGGVLAWRDEVDPELTEY